MSIPLPPDDPFLPTLRRELDRNFPEFKPVRDLTTSVSPPLSFQDRHIGSHLVLKRIKIVPSLHESLADSISEPLEAFIKEGHTFDLASYKRSSHNTFGKPPEQANSVAKAYHLAFGTEMVNLASKILITPEIPQWLELLQYAGGTFKVPPGEELMAEGTVMVSMRGDQLDLSASERQHLPKKVKNQVLGLNSIYDWMAYWSFFSLTKRGRSFVSHMPSTTHFEWQSAHTSGVFDSPQSPPPPPDASGGFAAKEVARYLDSRRKAMDRKPIQVLKSKARTIKVSRQKAKNHYTPIHKDYIQRAWSSAVYYDSTFIIFNCGSHERIGIRHRSSQTLYLSGLINTTHNNPSYGRIQLGLHLAILQDALLRRKPRRSYNEQHNVTLKRHLRDHDAAEDIPPPKRRKRSEITQVKLLNASETYQVSEAEKEMSERDALLISLHYGDYNSPSPSCFTRTGPSCVRGLFSEDFSVQPRRTTYTTSQYMIAKLRSPLGRGAIGTAHRAEVNLVAKSGEPLTHQCLVKLAFTPEACSSLVHEYGIYQHFAKKDMVSGIVRVHGLFQDTQTQTMALLMDFGGLSLRRRERELDADFEGGLVGVSKDEMDIIMKALQQIHETGMCHNDVRLDNIVINNAYEVAFIDFDRAGPPEWAGEYKEELDGLRDCIYCKEDVSDESTDLSSSASG